MGTYGNHGDFNSLYRLKPDAHAVYRVPPSSQTEQIELRRLDRVLPALVSDIPNPRVFLKMDTQGHDLSVFRGAQGVWALIVGLQSELAAIQLYESAPAISEFLYTYMERQFYPVRFHPVNIIPNGLVPEFDVIFHRVTGREVLRSGEESDQSARERAHT
jgi:hypothetical protein